MLFKGASFYDLFEPTQLRFLVTDGASSRVFTVNYSANLDIKFSVANFDDKKYNIQIGNNTPVTLVLDNDNLQIAIEPVEINGVTDPLMLICDNIVSNSDTYIYHEGTDARLYSANITSETNLETFSGHTLATTGTVTDNNQEIADFERYNLGKDGSLHLELDKFRSGSFDVTKAFRVKQRLLLDFETGNDTGYTIRVELFLTNTMQTRLLGETPFTSQKVLDIDSLIPAGAYTEAQIPHLTIKISFMASSGNNAGSNRELKVRAGDVFFIQDSIPHLAVDVSELSLSSDELDGAITSAIVGGTMRLTAIAVQGTARATKYARMPIALNFDHTKEFNITGSFSLQTNSNIYADLSFDFDIRLVDTVNNKTRTIYTKVMPDEDDFERIDLNATIPAGFFSSNANLTLTFGLRVRVAGTYTKSSAFLIQVYNNWNFVQGNITATLGNLRTIPPSFTGGIFAFGTEPTLTPDEPYTYRLNYQQGQTRADATVSFVTNRQFISLNSERFPIRLNLLYKEVPKNVTITNLRFFRLLGRLSDSNVGVPKPKFRQNETRKKAINNKYIIVKQNRTLEMIDLTVKCYEQSDYNLIKSLHERLNPFYVFCSGGLSAENFTVVGEGFGINDIFKVNTGGDNNVAFTNNLYYTFTTFRLMMYEVN